MNHESCEHKLGFHYFEVTVKVLWCYVFILFLSVLLIELGGGANNGLG